MSVDAADHANHQYDVDAITEMIAFVVIPLKLRCHEVSPKQ